jgi:hypothetical protein
MTLAEQFKDRCWTSAEVCTMYVSSHFWICVPILLNVSSYCYVRPHAKDRCWTSAEVWCIFPFLSLSFFFFFSSLFCIFSFFSSLAEVCCRALFLFCAFACVYKKKKYICIYILEREIYRAHVLPLTLCRSLSLPPSLTHSPTLAPSLFLSLSLSSCVCVCVCV